MILSALSTATSVLTIGLGAYVVYLAYRGYRRNQSESMRRLAWGILLIAVVPYLISMGLGPVLNLSDALALLGITLSHTVGLFAIFCTLD